MPSPVVRLLAPATASPLLAARLPRAGRPARPPDRPTSPPAPRPATAARSGRTSRPARWGGEAGTYRTTTRCRDINVRNASAFGTEACVVFVDKTDRCNYRTYLPANSGFVTVATNVRDGVNFRVRFSNLRYEYEPLVAYHAF